MLGKVVSEEDRIRIVSLRRTHKLKCKDVANLYGIHPDHVSRMVKEIERTGNTSVGRIGGDYSSGETLALLEPTLEHLKNNPSCTQQGIAEFWSEKHGVVRSQRVVCDFLKRHGIESDSRKRRRDAHGAGSKKDAEPEGRIQKRERHHAGFLTKKKRSRLESLLKSRCNLDDGVRKRVRAIISLDEGVSESDTATVLGVCKATVRTWFKLFNEHGWKWFVKEYGRRRGRDCKLDREQQNLLYKRLRNNPRQSVLDVKVWIKGQFGVDYSRSGVRLLVRALGFVFKKSRVIPRVPDVEEQEEWLKKFDLEMSKAPKGSVLLYGDGVFPRHRGEPAGGWVLKDEIPAIQQASGRQGLNAFGALEAETGRFFWVEDERINSDTIIKMLKILKTKYKDAPRIYLILDNAKCHKSKAVNDWIESQPKMKTMADGRKKRQPLIKLYFIPPYCPHFNKIERLWRMMRKEVTKNRVQSNAEEFKRALRKFFRSVHRNWKHYRTYVDAKFRIIDKRKYRIIS